MAGPLNIQTLREKLEKRFPILNRPKAKSVTIPGPAMDEVLLATKPQYPRLPIWQNIDHPRDNYFSIHILPLHLPLHPHLEGPVHELQLQMIADGVDYELCRLNDLYEQRFSHVWVAEMQRWVFRPIGLCSFLYKDSPAMGQPADEASFGGREKWWLTNVWLDKAQRNHRVLRNTIPYFKQWHPGFLLARDHPVTSRSFKDSPEHMHNPEGGSILWD